MKSPEFGHLLNVRDFDLNTPLHLAALHWQFLVLLLLARDGRVDLKLVNERNMTALDVVEEDMKEKDAPLRKVWPFTPLSWVIIHCKLLYK